ncbi:hypothetical protein Taro_032728 [Colocasia esculenta]|uniref:Uncharacterized protein n=1 Tax=Colocasia esculenta TaxID=4460 RepID=A0A843VZU4_COLES|nr:hypothetical protein [Colocasia esculenta]
MGKEEKQNVKRKVRLIVCLGAFIVSHSVLVSILCCTAGYITLLLLPILAKNTYISENALMPASIQQSLQKYVYAGFSPLLL